MGVSHSSGSLVERGVHRDDLGIFQQVLQVAETERALGGSSWRVAFQHAEAQRESHSLYQAADMADADDSDGVPFQIDGLSGRQTVQR